MADWKVLKGRRELAHSESADRTIHRAAEALTNKKLEGIYLRAYVGERAVRHGVSFRFEDDYRVIAWAYEHAKDDDDVFLMYSPKKYLCYHHDGSLTLELMK